MTLHRVDICGKKEDQNIKKCSEAKLQTATVHSAHCTSQAHFLQPRPNSSPTWPIFHLHLLAQTKAQCNGLTHVSFLVHQPFSSRLPHLPITCPFFLTFLHHPTCPSLPLLPASPYSHPITCNQPPLPSLLNPFNPSTLHLLL